ncbi:MAG: response regulator transcription factor [Desulfuromonadales bacterium]|nr:response regulator transcription factor [Desulfuromonadales bacterium]
MPNPVYNQGPVLIVEDDRNTALLVETYLQREGFSTVLAHDGSQALAVARETNPIFVILDIMLPGVDGWEICRTLRKESEVPILMLTAREEEIDRVAGLSMGADDYVVKPFSPRELVERVKAILRRARPVALQEQTAPISYRGLELDPVKRTVTRDGRPIPLTSSEYKLLYALMNAPGRAFSREVLLDHCHQESVAVIDRVIDVHIGKLRQKIEPDPSAPRFILTVRGFGYRFSDDNES